ncbi:hypothetical protein J6590_097164 [Homalodisca vitripennis]|nr:hypothetical protein J6590_097164 [Homalodisca vitripennis]
MYYCFSTCHWPGQVQRVYIEKFHTGPEKRNRGVVSYGVGEAVKRGEGLSAAAPSRHKACHCHYCQ